MKFEVENFEQCIQILELIKIELVSALTKMASLRLMLYKPHKKSGLGWMDGWMDGWVGGSKSQVKGYLQQSNISSLVGRRP